MPEKEGDFLLHKTENDHKILAKIKGEEAKKLLSELQGGKGIHFRVSEDENGIDPIIYLYKS